MPVEVIHTYLVHPRSGDEEHPIKGVTAPLEGDLFDLLNGIYEKSESECDIDITFSPEEGGEPKNECRDLILNYIHERTIDSGRMIANRLGGVTTNSSGIGLLFLIYGIEGASHKLVVSRFPTSTAILAEENARDLTVEFLQRVFMKSEYSYKSVVYKGTSITGGFWDGRATDKQVGNPMVQISGYWIKKFLASDFKTTAEAGTRRLAEALRSAARYAPTVDLKQEITAAATLGASLDGQSVSIDTFVDRFGLSTEARDVITRQLPNPNTLTEQFRFSRDEYARHVAFRSVELDTGAILTAHASDFDAVFNQEIVDADARSIRFSTEGRVVDENLRKVR